MGESLPFRGLGHHSVSRLLALDPGTPGRGCVSAARDSGSGSTSVGRPPPFHLTHCVRWAEVPPATRRPEVLTQWSVSPTPRACPHDQGLLSLLTSRGGGCPVLAAALWRERRLNHFKGAFKPPERKRGKVTSLVSSFLLSFFFLCLPSPSIPALPSRDLSVSLSPPCPGFPVGSGTSLTLPPAP